MKPGYYIATIVYDDNDQDECGYIAFEWTKALGAHVASWLKLLVTKEASATVISDRNLPAEYVVFPHFEDGDEDLEDQLYDAGCVRLTAGQYTRFRDRYRGSSKAGALEITQMRISTGEVVMGLYGHNSGHRYITRDIA